MNLLRIRRLGECELQQHACLGRIELLRHDGADLVILNLDVAADDPVADSRRAHDRRSFGYGTFHGLERRRRHVAVTNAGDDDSFRAVGDRGIDEIRRHPGMRVDHIHARQSLAGGDLERRRGRVRSRRRSRELPVVEEAHADQPDFGRHERLDVSRVAFGNGPRAVDIVVGDDEHSAPLRPRIRGHAHGVVDVQRTVRTERRGRPHRAGEDDRLVGLDDEIEEIRCLLHRIGAVRDGDAVDVRLSRQAVHFGGQLDPQLVVHVLAADGGHLHAAHIREFLHLRHGVDQHVDGDGAGFVSGSGRGLCRAGNRAAGRDDDDAWLRLGAEWERTPYCSERNRDGPPQMGCDSGHFFLHATKSAAFLHRVRISAERIRDISDRALRTHAVAGIVERG